MPSLLEKIGLKNSFTVELEIPQADFVSRLKKQVDKSDLSIFTNPFEAFSSSSNEYKGQVSMKGFEIKRKVRFLNSNTNYATAKGTFEQIDKRLLIHTTINSWHTTMYVAILFALIAWTLGLYFGSPFVIVILMIQSIFILTIPYLMMRSATKNLQRELEREFFYLTKN